MGTQERRERERAGVRRRIMAAARRLFAAQGYEAVSMRRIADAIEYSPTAIYLHFRDKHALVREICAADFAALAVAFGELAAVADRSSGCGCRPSGTSGLPLTIPTITG